MLESMSTRMDRGHAMKTAISLRRRFMPGLHSHNRKAGQDALKGEMGRADDAVGRAVVEG